VTAPVRSNLYARYGKRAFDIIACVMVMPIALPLLVFCGIAVWFDSPGPVIFRQMRTGRDGRRFPMLKFRTMVANAADLKESLAHLNVLAPPDFKIPNDPRITRVGRVMRKTSLDELPQLWNVLMGHMSLVGPRPTSFAANTYSLWHTRRLDVVPGITGLWQVRERHHVEFDDRLRLDIEYIRHQSLWLDLRIIFETLAAVVKRSGA
jgi:lipopolysaccharide/colanic/teichoic acid biosynthesis glycosyltransferase